MRVRLFDPLPSDLNYLIIKWLTHLDLALARVVCKGWSREIDPQRLTLEKDLFTMSRFYDRLEYISEVETCIWFPDSLVAKWYNEQNKNIANTCFRIYTMLFYYRKVSVEPRICDLYLGCPFSNLDTLLLPLLTVQRYQIDDLFWTIILNDDRDTLDWLFKRYVVKRINVSFITNGLDLDELTKPILNCLEYLYKTKETTKEFWEGCSKKWWKSNSRPNRMKTLVRIAKLCHYVPEEVCANLSYEHHEMILDVCGCEREVVTVFKRKKVE